MGEDVSNLDTSSLLQGRTGAVSGQFARPD
nr:MAG TPA: hypothetical protein [Caudoviricetes sp.]